MRLLSNTVFLPAFLYKTVRTTYLWIACDTNLFEIEVPLNRSCIFPFANIERIKSLVDDI